MFNYLLLLDEETEALTFCEKFTPFWTIIGYIIFAIKVLVPFLLILTGMITFVKAVMDSDDKKKNEAKSVLIKKVVYAISVFLVIQVVAIVIGLVSKNSFYNQCALCSFDPFNKLCYIYSDKVVDPSNYVKYIKNNKNNNNNNSGYNYFDTNNNNNSNKNNNNNNSSSGGNVSTFFTDGKYWNQKKYEDKRNSQSVAAIEKEECYSTICNENYEEGMIRVSNGVFYFAYNKSLNGNKDYAGSGDEGLNKVFYNRILAFAEAAAKEGITIDVIRDQEDGFRSIAAQNYYCCCAKYENCKTNDVPVPSTHPLHPEAVCNKRGTCNGNGNTGASVPGTSPHGWGLAADLKIRESDTGKKSTRAYRWAHNNAERFGLAFRIINEDWHVEPLYVCDINGLSGIETYKNCTRQKHLYCPQDSNKGSICVAKDDNGNNVCCTY